MNKTLARIKKFFSAMAVVEPLAGNSIATLDPSKKYIFFIDDSINLDDLIASIDRLKLSGVSVVRVES